MPSRLNIPGGYRFGRLTICTEAKAVNFHGKKGSPVRRFAWLCDCGNRGETDLPILRKGQAQSCGCLKRESSAETCRARSRHGLAPRSGTHRLYRVWSSMKERCHNPKNHKYPDYGARGIYVCEEWHDSVPFLRWAADNGWRPGLQIDRIDNDGPYHPDNCRFVTAKENSANRRRARR